MLLGDARNTGKTMADDMTLEAVDHLGGHSLVAGSQVEGVQGDPNADRLAIRHSRFKRVVDVVLASAALVFLAPLLATAAIAIKLDSRGPVIFRQRRTGLDGRTFTIFKFRSMTVAPEGGRVVQAQEGDARITRVGNILRRSSIDELPQLFNVVRGEMSLVGPRPHAISHDEEFAELAPEYTLRFRSPPGMTGMAQLAGERGPVNGPQDVRERTRLDLAYQENWSLGLDLWLLIKTPAVLLLQLVRRQSF